MKAVVDTNVLVSALIRQGTAPAEVLDDVLGGALTVLIDQRILDEYQEVDFPVAGAIRVVNPKEWTRIKMSMQLLRELGKDERGALEPNEPIVLAIACKRCRRVQVQEVLGIVPRAEPERAPYVCTELDPTQPSGKCGREIWTYDDNEIGRRNAAALGIPTG